MFSWEQQVARSLLVQEEPEDTKGQSESAYRRRTDKTMAKGKSTKGQTTIYKTYT
jgi:hypothetical protein